MSRVHPFSNPIKSTRSTISLAFTGAMLVVLLAAGLVQAAAVTVGYRDFGFDPSKAGRATADSPQSKLWFAGGFWYGGLFNAATSNYEIYRHNDATHAWATTGDTVDSRDKTNADYLYDPAHNKLYVASTRDSCNAVSNPTPGTCNDAINIYRYTVNLANALASQYTLDPGFPVAIVGGPYPGTGMSTGGARTVTVVRDAERVYVGWTRQSATNAAHSTTSVAYSTNAGETTWSAPVLINQGEDGQDNTSALVAFGTNHVGIYYTDMHAAGADVGNFRAHTAGQPGGTWGAVEVATATSVDNQANAKADTAGNVYVAIKTNSAAEQIRLLRRTPTGTWSQRGVADAASTLTRAQVAIDPTFNGGIGTAIVVMNDNAAGNGSIYYKMAPLTGAGALVYTIPGKGTILIDSATDNDMEDVTTTKQVLTNASGLLVEATDQTSKFYMHNHLGLPDAFDTTGPVGTININGNPTPDATKVTAVTLNISATDVSGVVEMRIANSPDGTTCPTSGTPALLTGSVAEPYATTKAWTLSAGDGIKRVCIQFRDQPLFGTPNWSVPVSDTIRLDTTAPTGTVTINGGDASTPIATVSVAVPATDATGVANVRISNTPTVSGGILTGGTTFPYGTPKPWTLLPGDGLKTVYVQWQDALGTWSAVASDTITLDSDDTTFTAITPVRLLDSRDNNPVGMTIFSHGVPKSFQITGRGGIPASAVAITGNLTVTGQTAAGFVTLGPDVSNDPNTSTINFPIGDNRANGVFVSLDGSGKLEATYKASGSNPAAKKAHLVLDVTGYFVPGAAGNEYFGVTPARFLDTRDNVPGGSHVLHDKAPYGFQVGGRTVSGTAIPADAVAITGNLTVTGQTKGGFLSLTPTSIADPETSTLNFPKGDNRANNVTVKLGAGGMLFVVYRGTGVAHAILDVTGYFRNDAAGLTFVPLAPTRTVDTRSDFGIFNPLQHGAPKSFTVRGVAGVGSDAEAFTGNVTIVGQTRAGFVSVTPTPVANPNTSTINFPKGDTRANGLAGRINAADGKASAVYRATGGPGSTEFIVDITGYFH